MAHGCYINVSECFIYKTLASTVIYVESFADFFLLLHSYGISAYIKFLRLAVHTIAFFRKASLAEDLVHQRLLKMLNKPRGLFSSSTK